MDVPSIKWHRISPGWYQAELESPNGKTKISIERRTRFKIYVSKINYPDGTEWSCDNDSLAVAKMACCQPTAHRFAFSDSASLRFGQARTDSASLRFVSGMMSSHRGAPDSPLTPGGVESSVSYGRRPLRESLDIRALPPSRRPRPSGERQTGVTGRFPERRAEPTFLADEMSAPADFQVNDAVSEERTSGRSDALSVRSMQWELQQSIEAKLGWKATDHTETIQRITIYPATEGIVDQVVETLKGMGFCDAEIRVLRYEKVNRVDRILVYRDDVATDVPERFDIDNPNRIRQTIWNQVGYVRIDFDVFKKDGETVKSPSIFNWRDASVEESGA